MSPEQESPGTSRRTFLDVVIGVCTTITGAAMVLPSVLYLWPGARGGDTGRVEVQGADALAVGQSTTVALGSKPVIVIRHRSGYRAVAATCTHLGCLVSWDGDTSRFLCPCHAAAFDETGKVLSGPPPSPLPTYDVHEVDGRMYVSEA